MILIAQTRKQVERASRLLELTLLVGDGAASGPRWAACGGHWYYCPRNMLCAQHSEGTRHQQVYFWG